MKTFLATNLMSLVFSFAVSLDVSCGNLVRSPAQRLALHVTLNEGRVVFASHHSGMKGRGLEK